MALELDYPFQEPVPETAIHPTNCEAARKLRDELKKDTKLDDLRAEVDLMKQETITWRYIHCTIHALLFSVVLGLSWYNYSAISEVGQKQESWQGNFTEELQTRLQMTENRMMENITLLLKQREIYVSENAVEVYKTILDQDLPTLSMTRFSHHKADSDKWTSDPVFTHHRGYKICLRVIANGSSFGKGTHVSVFIHFMRGEFDDLLKWPFRGRISFRLLDQQGVNHKIGTVIYDDNVADGVCTRVREGEVSKGEWGHIKFITHEELKPYLKDDMLSFQMYEVELH